MHDLIHDLAQSIMKNEYYTMDARSTSKDFGQEIRHLTIMVDELNNVPVCSLKNKGGLQSLILTYEELLRSIINLRKTFLKGSFRFLKKLSSLRVFEVPKNMQSLNLCYLRYLKHLRYLNLSDNSMIKTLPESICGLLNLQTLKLDNCSELESLPRNTKDLINLRHLPLEGCDELKYMPRGMSQLKNLKTLSLFVIGKESDGQLDELKELDIRYLDVRNLERVSDVSLARGISMSKNSSINELKLSWRDEDGNRHEKIGEALEVSSTCLKGLTMIGYKGVNIPKWVGESSASLTNLELLYMNNVQHIFTMNNMNTIGEIGMLDQLFPLLEVLEIDCMENLMELVSPPIPITTTGAGTFPNLHKILINYCPRLGALPPHLKSLKDVVVFGKCRDELLDSIISNHSGLTHLSLIGCMNDRRVLVGAASTSSHDQVLFPLLECLRIKNMKNLRKLVSPPIPITTIGAFPNLREIIIDNCPKLRALPPHLKSLKDVKVEGECRDELLDSIISNHSGLTQLSLIGMSHRRVLVGAASTSRHDVVLFPFLEELTIMRLKNLRELVSPHVPITTTIGAFPNLCKISIHDCPNLGALPRSLKSLQDVWISKECSDELLHSIISNPRNLINLSIRDMDERIVLFAGANNDEALMIDEDEITSSLAADNNEAQAGGQSTFRSLRHLTIRSCSKLRCLFDEECEELAAASSERGRTRTRSGLIRNLNDLFIDNCPELMISVEQWRNLATPSLQWLRISDCRKLVPSKEEEAQQVIALIRSLGREKFAVDFLANEEEDRRKHVCIIK